jgi:ATP phosphoribosyltransferase regulatory subunit
MMKEKIHSLLPSGFFDLLPPDARQQRVLYQQVLDTLSSFGYQEVSPPLMEFEASLLANHSAALPAQTFRLMDPISHEMMGLRTDMTLQIARIANSRLHDQPKPLRLCYAGTCLRVVGEGLRRERQFMQAGAELIGSESLAADIEIIRVAIASLASVQGIGQITVDITLPELNGLLLTALPEALRPHCRHAMQQKDSSSLREIEHPLIPALVALLQVTGCEDPQAVDWAALIAPLPADAGELLRQWVQRITAIKAANLPARLTFDPLEQQGFDYHSGLAFSLFASRVESEIGRGGRYFLQDNTPATGFTIYLNPLRYVMQPMQQNKKCYIPLTEAFDAAETLRAEGWMVLHALSAEENPAAQARAQGCSHYLENGTLKEIEAT